MEKNKILEQFEIDEESTRALHKRTYEASKKILDDLQKWRLRSLRG